MITNKVISNNDGASKNPRIVVFTLVIAALLAGGLYSFNAMTQQPGDYFAPRPWRLAKTATKVEVCLLETTEKIGSDQEPKFVVANIWRAACRTEMIRPSNDWLLRLRKLLNDGGNYGWDYGKMCLPRPGVLIRFTSADGATADVLLCFACDMLSIGVTGEEKWEDFDPMKAELLKLVRELFPNDETLAAVR